MTFPRHPFRRQARRFHRVGREIMAIVRGLCSTSTPLLAHMVVTRRCNLACAYCNEYDHFSPPVPAGMLRERIDRLAALGLRILTVSGGEPLLHPSLAEVISHTRSRGMIAGLITNGYLLTPKKIRQLNGAGLDHLQISIDNLVPGPVSKKSLKTLDRKLQMLADCAEFHVNVNSVLGGGAGDPRDALVIARRAIELEFTSTVGLIHDGRGQLKPLSEAERDVLRKIHAIGKRSYSRFNRFQENIAQGKPNDWRCRAGARYLYICEDGLVHYCSQQRGSPGRPLSGYTPEDIRREFLTEKSCAPSCTVSCVHQVSYLDGWRAPQVYATPSGEEAGGLVQIETTAGD